MIGSAKIILLSRYRNGAIVTITRFADGGGLTAPCYAVVFISPAGIRTIVSDCCRTAVEAEIVARQISEQLNIRFVTSDRAQPSRPGA
jgi:hypothetical protein